MGLRKKKLINPGLQLRLVVVFLCCAALAVQVEAILISFTLTRLAERMPTDGQVLLREMPEFVRTNLLLTFLVLAPLTLAVGIVATFRIAGPLHHFEQFLRSVLAGQQIAPCKIRKNDELQEMCTLLNDVTATQRAVPAAKAPAAAAKLESVEPAIPAPAEPKSKARSKKKSAK